MRTDIFEVIVYIKVNLNVQLSHIKSTFLNQFIYAGCTWYFALNENEINHIERCHFLRWVLGYWHLQTYVISCIKFFKIRNL